MVRHDTEHQRGQGTQWTGNLGKQPFDRKVNPMKTALRKLTLAWPLVIFLLLPPLTRAETAVQAWVNPMKTALRKLTLAWPDRKSVM